MAPSWSPPDAFGGSNGKNGGSGPAHPGGPAGPAAPGPTSPGPAAGPAGPGFHGRGMALTFHRGRSAKERLQIDWTYPVWKPKAGPTDGATTFAAEIEHALPLDEAFAWIASDAHRPLLVLRECDLCKGTDHALLSRTLDNEQTVLLTHWFRCVKLPTNVLDSKHPFAALFRNGQTGDHLPHLFFCDA